MESEEIILHEFPPFGGSITASPFPVRVEMFLRWGKIPYTTTFKKPMHSHTKKTPWIEYEGKALPDSDLIIQRLSSDKHIDMDHHLSTEDRAVSRAFQRMLSEGALFAGFAWRFLLSDNGKLMIKAFLGSGVVGSIASQFAGVQMRKNIWAQGVGRMEKDQILQQCYDDISACANFLGSKLYFMGDRVSSADCLVFGFLQIINFTLDCSTGENPIKDFLHRHANLEAYRKRIQTEFFPDWDEICSKKEVRRTWNP